MELEGAVRDLEYDSTDPEEVYFMKAELQNETLEETDAQEERLIPKRILKKSANVRQEMEDKYRRI